MRLSSAVHLGATRVLFSQEDLVALLIEDDSSFTLLQLTPTWWQDDRGESLHR